MLQSDMRQVELNLPGRTELETSLYAIEQETKKWEKLLSYRIFGRQITEVSNRMAWPRFKDVRRRMWGGKKQQTERKRRGEDFYAEKSRETSQKKTEKIK